MEPANEPVDPDRLTASLLCLMKLEDHPIRRLPRTLRPKAITY